MRYFILLLLLPFVAQSQTNIYGKQIFKDSVKFEKPFKFRGAELIGYTNIKCFNNVFGMFNTDTTLLLSFQDDSITALSSYAISDAGVGFLLVQNKGVSAQYLTNSNGDYQYLNIDSLEADLRLDVAASGNRYQCGVYNNDANESDYTSELSIHNIDNSKDIYSLRLHEGWLDYMIDGDTSDASPDAYGVFHRDSTMLEIGRTNHSATTFASRFVQDTAFYFKWDSSDAYLNHYYHSDTVYIKSNKEIKFGSNVSFSNVINGSATLDFGSIPNNGHETLTFSVSGASVGDVVSLGIPDASMDAHASFVAWVSATNTVSVKCFNFDGTSFNPASGTFKVKIFK